MCKDVLTLGAKEAEDNVIQIRNPDTVAGSIQFRCAGCESPFPLLELGPKDEIRVRGKLIERDQEIVEALRHFITHEFLKG